MLFLLSGAATAVPLRRRAANRRWLRERVRRMGLPLLPASCWSCRHSRTSRSYSPATGAPASPPSIACTSAPRGDPCADARGRLDLPTWSHLCFRPNALVYTLVLWAVLQR